MRRLDGTGGTCRPRRAGNASQVHSNDEPFSLDVIEAKVAGVGESLLRISVYADLGDQFEDASLETIAQACQPLIFENLVKKFVNLGPADPAAVAKATESFNKEAKMLDAHLARHKYLVNDTLTIADFSVAAPLFHAQGAGMPVGPYANIGAWFGRVSALPCWNETAPQMAAAA